MQRPEPFETDVLPQPEAISALTGQLADYLAAAGVDARATHHVGLAVEELLTNLGSHGGGAARPARVRISIEPDRVRVALHDSGAAFDPRQAAQPVLGDTIEERAVGGLGLFLLRQFATEIGYERRDGMNHTTFTVLRGPAR
jgi:anti-sigma regulatory factor (Ser/Thr protein kinase)